MIVPLNTIRAFNQSSMAMKYIVVPLLIRPTQSNNLPIVFDLRYQKANLLQNNTYSYVKMKDIQAIKEEYSEKGVLKVLSKSCGFFMKQAWLDFKSDYNLFQQIKSIPIHQRTQQQKILYRKIKIDMIKFGPALVIFNIPFGFPLFYIYLKLFPLMIPSWMMVDSIHEEILQRREQRRVEAWKFYQQNFDQNVILPYLREAISKSNQSLQDMRRIACICYRDYTDGTEYLSEKLGLYFRSGLISPKISLFLLKNQLKTQIDHDYELENELKEFSTFEEKLFYKLSKQIEKLSS